MEHALSKSIHYVCKNFRTDFFSKNATKLVIKVEFSAMMMKPLIYVYGFSRILTCTEPVSLCLPIVLFVLCWYFCTFSTSMLLFGTLGNNSRRKVEVVKLLILKYYLQFVVPITFMIRIRRKLSSILVKSISTPKPGNLWTTSRLSVWPTGPQTLWHRVWTKGPCPGDPGEL